MKWKELRAFLNANFYDDDSIVLALDYNTNQVLIIRDEAESCLTRCFVFQDNLKRGKPSMYTTQEDNTPIQFTEEYPKMVEYSDQEISTFFSSKS